MTETFIEETKERQERPDPAGIVLRGSAAKGIAEMARVGGTPPKCRAAAGGKRGLTVVDCDRLAVMEIYGIGMCEAHGEEAAAGALEEIRDDLDNELQRPMNSYVRDLSPHLEAALRRGFGILEDVDWDAASEAALLEAFPLDGGVACSSIRHYIEDPDDGREPPHDAFMDSRLLLHRHMRLAFEKGADWLVEMLEAERVQVAAQAAYAMALEREAGLRP